MRVKPVGPVVLRCAIDDDVIEGFPVPAGTQVIINLARIHRRRATFDQPNRFQPERFLDKVSVSTLTSWDYLNRCRYVVVHYNSLW